MPFLNRSQLRRIDQLSLARYHIPTMVLMENAARSATEVALHMLKREPGKFVTIFAGPGNNGGDGLAIARHLHNLEVNVDVVPVFNPEKLTGDALTNWRIVEAMGIEITSLPSAELTLASEPDLVIDALLGTGATGAPRGDILKAIDLINTDSHAPLLAIDIPSGLDCDTGKPLGSCVRATCTITFAAEKVGFTNPAARAFLGDVIVGDIGCPRELIDEIAGGANTH